MLAAHHKQPFIVLNSLFVPTNIAAFLGIFMWRPRCDLGVFVLFLLSFCHVLETKLKEKTEYSETTWGLVLFYLYWWFRFSLASDLQSENIIVMLILKRVRRCLQFILWYKLMFVIYKWQPFDNFCVILEIKKLWLQQNFLFFQFDLIWLKLIQTLSTN